MASPKMQHRQLRRRVPVIIRRGEEPRDLAHLLADLERRQAPEPESGDEAASQPGGPEPESGDEGASQPGDAKPESGDEGASQPGDEAASEPGSPESESESSDSSGDGSSSGSSSSASSKSEAKSEAPKSPTPPATGPPGQPSATLPASPGNMFLNGTIPPNRGAIIVPVPGMNPTTLLTSTTRATTPTNPATPIPTSAPPLQTTPSSTPSSATSPATPLSSLLIPSPSPPALSLPLPVPMSSDLLSSGLVSTSTDAPPTATPEPSPPGESVNAGGTVTASTGGGDAPGILAGSIAGVAAVTGLSIYLYRRYTRSGEVKVALDDRSSGPGPTESSSGPDNANNAAAPNFAPPSFAPHNFAENASLGVPSHSPQLDRMTALDERQYAAYRNLMGADR
ncbi:hypothetical protein PpBr36_04780 [Pyricularia pennisetigena]|uniref:hypothetical protein n=1 Tax=Pyricularia pennisetigena TaxID=1578925 RepID=UPI0011547A29|nr:hypothetical protein PpBr36_04780 [Pyricularia pennisetigena]TLS26123.1 hypothetical protein PpBr36_04780 [Pyricularia pennisetigena]